MKSHHTSTKPYLFTFAALLALPFALQAASERAPSSSPTTTNSSSTRVGSNAETVGTSTGEFDGMRVDIDKPNPENSYPRNSRADRAGMTANSTRDHTVDYDYDNDYTRGVTVGPRVDGSSRTSNGVARGVVEARANARDQAMGVMPSDADMSGSDMSEMNRTHEGQRNRYSDQSRSDRMMTENRRNNIPVTSGVDLNRDDAVAMRLNSERTTAAIKSTEFAGREHAVALAENGVSEGKQIVSALRSGGAAVQPDARINLDAAIGKVDKAQSKLDAAITSSRNSNASRWGDVRDQLSDCYQDYVDAVEDAREVAVAGGVRFNGQVDASDTSAFGKRS